MEKSSAIAFLGLGTMGMPMSLNLAMHGFSVRAWNRSPRTAPEDNALDYQLVESAAKAAQGVDILLTMLPDLREVRDICLGAEGALVDARPGAVIVVMGTVSGFELRDFADEVGKAGFCVVDAPVSGGEGGAKAATLSIMVGGAADQVERVWPALESMGSVVRHFGDLGAGQIAKACNQIIVAATLTALGEAVALGERCGLEPSQLLDTLAGGLAGSRALDAKRETLLSRSFVPGGRASFQHKDLGFALEAARRSGVTLPVTALVDQLFGAMCWTGHGDDDHSGIVQMIDLLSVTSTTSPRP